MSAERHALDAALAYSAKLENQIKQLKDENQEKRRRIADLSCRLSGVKDAIRDHGKVFNDGPQCEASMPGEMMEAQGYKSADCEEKADCPRCKNCGAPI